MSDLLKNIYVVMVETKTPGNIGSSVRAMKNMGINNLRLVNPIEGFREDVQQRSLGYRSQEIVENCEIFDTLKDALNDISLVFATTAKSGKWRKDFIEPQQAAKMCVKHALNQKVAIVFGREESGLSVEELQLANYYVSIPSAVSYPSLNLSQAVMVMCYEVYKSFLKEEGTEDKELPIMADSDSFQRLHANIWSLMKTAKLREDENGLFFHSLKRSLGRTRWTSADIAVYDRLCKQVRWYLEGKC